MNVIKAGGDSGLHRPHAMTENFSARPTFVATNMQLQSW
jgi:hypothetical protein